MAKHPMLDFVPLARAGWKVADADVQAQLLGQALKLDLPKPRPVTVAAAGVGSDEQSPSPRITLAAHLSPPTANRLHRQLCPVVVNPHPPPSPLGPLWRGM